jgi:hypothetical protein
MRKLKIIEHISLDGVIQSSGEDDFPTLTGLCPIGPPLDGMKSSPRMASASICCSAVAPTICGRATGQRHRAVRWRTASMRQPNISLPIVRKVLNGGPFEGLGPDIVEGIRRIKSQAGPDLILWGSSTLTSTLLEHGLADEVMLVVYPVLLGTGKRFFAEGTPPRSFELVSTKAMPSGIILSTYKVAGPLRTA